MYFSNSIACLARNNDVATKPREVGARKFVDLVRLLQRREEGAAGGEEEARRIRDDVDAFRTGPGEGKCKGTIVLDGVDLARAVIGPQNLAAERPEA